MILSLVIMLLLIGGIGLMLMNVAIEHAEEGYEDSAGFHQNSPEWVAQSDGTEERISSWDQLNGACCSLDTATPLRSMGNRPIPFPRQ